MENKKVFVLPIAVVSPTDVARLTRELNNLDEFFRQSEIRQGGAPQSALRYSRLLDEVVIANNLNLLQQQDRDYLLASFKDLEQRAPVLHISFSVDPPGPYVQKIVNYLRLNLQGDILVRVGLQPNIGAGCVVRTTNKSFDFSLRRFFDNKHEFFMKKLHEILSPELEDEQFNAENNNQSSNNQPVTEETVTESDATDIIVPEATPIVVQETTNGTVGAPA